MEQIDPTTLAIHFPDMLNCKGNRVFASLNKNGKGGDIVSLPSEKNVFINITYSNKGQKTPDTIESTVIYIDSCFCFVGMYGYEGKECDFKDVTVIGRQD